MNASFRIFGESEFSGRLPEVLMGLFAVLFVYFAVRKCGQKSGIFSAAALATSRCFLIARQNIVDMPYVAWQTAAIMSLMLGLYGGKITEGRYVYWFWFFTGWGLLTKGLLCLMFPGVILFAYIIISGDFGVLRRLRILKECLFSSR
jgi:4-amino-4-deoxy-L-arabinose transferase-like glycosyltransferase